MKVSQSEINRAVTSSFSLSADRKKLATKRIDHFPFLQQDHSFWLLLSKTSLAALLFLSTQPINSEDLKDSFTIEQVNWSSHSDMLLQVRNRVFIEEQKVPAEIEVDEHDQQSTHFVALDQSRNPIGTARLLPNGRVGRVAVLIEWRRKGVGRALMKETLTVSSQRGIPRVSLHAQVSSIPFYSELGFETKGPEFDEAGIPHRQMHLDLRKKQTARRS